MIIIALLLIMSIQSNLIDTTLPPLTKYEHVFSSQNFTIKNRENFKYEFQNYGDPEVNIVDIAGKSSNDSCSFIPYGVQQQTLAEYKLQTSVDNNRYSALKTSFAIVKFQHLLYTISNSMQLTAYNYTQNRITKQASVILQQKVDLATDSQVYFALTADESLLFLFSAYGIWRIQTHAVLTRIQKLPLTVNFTVHGATNIGDYMLVSTMTNGIVIFEINNKNLVFAGAIVNYQKQQIYPIDLTFDSKNALLFVLDNIKNIYVYKMIEKDFYYYDLIEFQHSANFKISAIDNRLYYSFIEGNTMQIAEIQYNETLKRAQLVRYYKQFDYANDFIVSKDQLIVLSHETLDIYPAFVDPRLITRSHNGIRLPLTARRFQYVISDLYLFTSEEFIKLIKLKTSRAHILCNFKTAKQSISIDYKANVTDCSSFSATSPKSSFNSYCETSKKINIQINIPQQIQRQRILMYAIVIMVIMFFFAGLICLVQWRNGRLDIIDKLADEIRRHKDKQKRARQFIQQNDIQLPRSVIFSNNDIGV